MGGWTDYQIFLGVGLRSRAWSSATRNASESQMIHSLGSGEDLWEAVVGFTVVAVEALKKNQILD